jgi:hypothetical protein
MFPGAPHKPHDCEALVNLCSTKLLYGPVNVARHPMMSDDAYHETRTRKRECVMNLVGAQEWFGSSLALCPGCVQEYSLTALSKFEALASPSHSVGQASGRCCFDQ